jgi:hypothetical protein
MTQSLRDTKYARELATAKLPSGPSGSSFVAIERIHVKQADQVEIRFSWWEGSRMMPRPLDLPEEELLPLLRCAFRAGVFSEAFTEGLRVVLNELSSAPPGGAPDTATELERIQAHFHALMRSRAVDLIREDPANLPILTEGLGTQDEPMWYPIESMDGGFKYWWDPGAVGLRLMTENWSRAVAGSGQLHEVTSAGARLLAEGFV